MSQFEGHQSGQTLCGGCSDVSHRRTTFRKKERNPIVIGAELTYSFQLLIPYEDGFSSREPHYPGLCLLGGSVSNDLSMDILGGRFFWSPVMLLEWTSVKG